MARSFFTVDVGTPLTVTIKDSIRFNSLSHLEQIVPLQAQRTSTQFLPVCFSSEGASLRRRWNVFQPFAFFPLLPLSLGWGCAKLPTHSCQVLKYLNWCWVGGERWSNARGCIRVRRDEKIIPGFDGGSFELALS